MGRTNMFRKGFWHSDEFHHMDLARYVENSSRLLLDQHLYFLSACNNILFCFIHSFIHYMDLYSTSSRLLLRSAPDSSTAKKSSITARVEFVRLNPGEQSQCQWKPIP